MDWDKLRIFHAAAAAGSFTHAGEALHMSQSAVSRQVSALERDLKVALFHRHARGLVLTEQGELLYATVAEVMTKLQTAETLLADTTTKPSGELRIAAPVGLGTVWVSQRLREFMDLYPEIRVDLILDDGQIDIAMRAADVGIWTREPEQTDLIRRPLLLTSMPSTSSSPEVTGETHVIMRMVLVLPAPFGPSRPKHSPSATEKSMPSTATSSPKRFTRPRARMISDMALWRLDSAPPTEVGGLISGCRKPQI